MIIVMFLCFVVYATITIRLIQWVLKPMSDYLDNKTTEQKKEIINIIITNMDSINEENEETSFKPQNRAKRF